MTDRGPTDDQLKAFEARMKKRREEEEDEEASKAESLKEYKKRRNLVG